MVTIPYPILFLIPTSVLITCSLLKTAIQLIMIITARIRNIYFNLFLTPVYSLLKKIITTIFGWLEQFWICYHDTEMRFGNGGVNSIE